MNRLHCHPFRDRQSFQMAKAPRAKRTLFNLAKEVTGYRYFWSHTRFQYKIRQLRKGIVRYDTIADKVVFKKVRMRVGRGWRDCVQTAAALGGRIKFMITGGETLFILLFHSLLRSCSRASCQRVLSNSLWSSALRGVRYSLVSRVTQREGTWSIRKSLIL